MLAFIAVICIFSCLTIFDALCYNAEAKKTESKEKESKGKTTWEKRRDRIRAAAKKVGGDAIWNGIMAFVYFVCSLIIASKTCGGRAGSMFAFLAFIVLAFAAAVKAFDKVILPFKALIPMTVAEFIICRSGIRGAGCAVAATWSFPKVFCGSTVPLIVGIVALLIIVLVWLFPVEEFLAEEEFDEDESDSDKKKEEPKPRDDERKEAKDNSEQSEELTAAEDLERLVQSLTDEKDRLDGDSEQSEELTAAEDLEQFVRSLTDFGEEEEEDE